MTPKEKIKKYRKQAEDLMFEGLPEGASVPRTDITITALMFQLEELIVKLSS